MKLTHKERMRRALRREPIDRFPTQINYTGDMGEKLAAHLGVSLTELPARLDNHLVRVDLIYPRRTSEDGRIAYDWWGVGWSTETEGYWPVDSPLAQAQTLEDFPWPDPTILTCWTRRKRPSPAMGGEILLSPILASVCLSVPGRCVASRPSLWTWRSTWLS